MDTLMYPASVKPMSHIFSLFFIVFSFAAKPHTSLLFKRPKKRYSLTYIEIVWVYCILIWWKLWFSESDRKK